MNISDLELISKKIRMKTIELSHKTGAAHLGSCLSCIDILSACYWKFLSIDPNDPSNPGRDYFLMSKGHAATAFYSTLFLRGFFSEEFVDQYTKNGSKLAEHPGPNCAPGVEIGSGSLGHGLGIGIGISIAAKLQGGNPHVYVLMGDGECNEGSVWEAAMFAASKKLNRVIAIIDYNKWQATGRSNHILNLKSLKDKWASFGWQTYEIDGNNMTDLVETLNKAKEEKYKPIAIIANTIKGKGISFMEDDNNWHYRIPTKEEVEKSREELKLS